MKKLPNSFGLYDKSKILTEKTGLPGVVFEGDMSDLRFFSEGHALMESFFQRLG